MAFGIFTLCAECHCAKCHYVKCRYSLNFKLDVLILYDIMLSVLAPNLRMLV
jgi:hypothetical protein